MPALLLKKEFWIVVFCIASLLFAGWIGWKISNSNFVEYKLEQAQKYTEERNRQIKANELAKEREKVLLEELNKKKLELDALAKEAISEAEKDPTAGNIALPESSVLRINKVR